MKSSVIYRSPYACNNAKNVKPSMQHRTEDNNQQVEDEQTIQAEEWNLPETEDCSSSVIARSIENSTDNYTTEAVPKGKRKVKVSDPVSMKKEPSLESVGLESSSRQRNRQPAASKHNH